MGLFDDDAAVAPEIQFEDIPLTEEDQLEDTEPIEYNNILTTPIDLPDSKTRRPGKIEKELKSLYTMIGAGIFPFDQQVGGTIVAQAEPCAKAMADLAAQNAAVRRALESMLATTTYGAVIAAHLPIAVMVATKYIPHLRDNYGAVVNQFMNGQQAA